jgi:hypothetical protein
MSFWYRSILNESEAGAPKYSRFGQLFRTRVKPSDYGKSHYLQYQETPAGAHPNSPMFFGIGGTNARFVGMPRPVIARNWYGGILPIREQALLDKPYAWQQGKTGVTN